MIRDFPSVVAALSKEREVTMAIGSEALKFESKVFGTRARPMSVMEVSDHGELHRFRSLC